MAQYTSEMMDKVKDTKVVKNTLYKFNSFTKKLDDFLQQQKGLSKYLKQIEDSTHIKPSYLVIGAIAVFLACFVTFATFIISVFLDELLWYLLYLAPIYGSFKAIESPGTEDDAKWLIYWICFAAVGLLEFFWSLFSFVAEYYTLFKTAFFIWCMYPSPKWNGSIVIYEYVIRPLYLKNEKELSSAFSVIESTLDASAEAAAQVDSAQQLLKQAAETVSTLSAVERALDVSTEVETKADSEQILLKAETKADSEQILLKAEEPVSKFAAAERNLNAATEAVTNADAEQVLLKVAETVDDTVVRDE